MFSNLKKVYGEMETEELIRIAFVDHADYKPEAVSIAMAELKKRGISKGQEVTLTANRILQERQDAEEKDAMKPLSAKEKVLFVVFPVIAFYYMIFVPKVWKQRNKQAFKFYMFGLGAWFLFRFLVSYLLPKLGD
jgi:hypothetical protein